jgi:hypothetical protein
MASSAELEAKSLGDILKNSPAAEFLNLGSLPQEDDVVPTPEDSEEEEKEVPEETSEEAENDSDEEQNQEDSEEESADEDDKSTQDTDLPLEEDIDWEYKIPVTVDGKTEYVTLEEIRKGFATDKHLSQKGRELGELRKEIEAERDEKLKELVVIGTTLNSDLMSAEQNLASQYHSIAKEIEKAREDNDTYTARELKEKQEEVQKNYWAARNKRESAGKVLAEQFEKVQAEEQQKLLQQFSTDIQDLIPGFDEKTATSIRQFAIEEGIPETLLDSVYDAKIVKFIDEFRRLKTAANKGAAKRKSAPTAKAIPIKKGKTQNAKDQAKQQDTRSKVLSGAASADEQIDFLKSISTVSRKF